MTRTAAAKVVLTYFSVASMIFATAYFFPRNIPASVFLSILLLFPIFLWHRNWRGKKKLSKEINGRDKRRVIFWVLTIFSLAMLVRIPSALLFGMPYEKTPLIYLTILTIVIVEKTDVSAFGFKTKNFGKSLLYGLVFFALLYGLALLISNILVYAFTYQLPVQTFDFMPVLSAMPFMTLCVGISEEGLFRGYTQTHLEKFYSKREAVFIQAVLFGVWHFVWNLSPFDPLGMARYVGNTFFIGLMFGYMYSKSRNLVPLMFAHGLWNSVPEGIVTSVAALEMSNQMLLWTLPYLVSAMFMFFFIKYLVKEI